MTVTEPTESIGAIAPRAPLSRRYRTLFVLGRGGMGSVEAALAIDPEPGGEAPAYDRIVALKRLLPEARDARRTEMFLREARLAAMLDHPNVVRAFDYGELDGELYLAMEYVEGQPLSRVLRALVEAKKTLPLDLVAHVLAEVCRGLHAAHELSDPATGQALNLVHRDVSPQNVMLGYDGRVRLLDFGVAKIETESLTKTGEVKGKTPYMSPEQAMGDRIDRRSDLFGVGAMLYECVRLKRMWGDGTDMDVIRKLALEEPPALVDVPDALARIHARLVARRPEDRPATAAEVADALEAYLRDSSTADDGPRRALGDLLATHFDAEAHAHREKLSAALEDVAPAQANELRASVLPEPTSHAVPVSPPPARTGRTLLFAFIGLVVTLGVYRLVTPDTRPVVTAPPPPAVTLEPRVEPAAPTLSIPDVPAASASPPSVAAPKRVLLPARPSVPPRPAGSSAASSSVSTRPVPSPPKPIDVDEHPF